MNTLKKIPVWAWAAAAVVLFLWWSHRKPSSISTTAGAGAPAKDAPAPSVLSVPTNTGIVPPGMVQQIAGSVVDDAINLFGNPNGVGVGDTPPIIGDRSYATVLA